MSKLPMGVGINAAPGSGLGKKFALWLVAVRDIGREKERGRTIAMRVARVNPDCRADTERRAPRLATNRRGNEW